MQITIIDNVLEPTPYNVETKIDNLLDFLVAHYPKGFTTPTKVLDPVKPIEFEDFNKSYDAVIIVHYPAIPITAAVFEAAWFATVAANIAIAAAISFVAGQIFSPSLPSSLSTRTLSKNSSSSVYNVNAQQNEAKLGQPIPLLYGRTRVYPSLIEKPYIKYVANEAYIYQTMCVGLGRVAIEQILVNDTVVDTIDRLVIGAVYLSPLDHPNIESYIINELDANYRQRVRTLVEVDGLELASVPYASTPVVRFDGNTITFYPNLDGTEVNLSVVDTGTLITVSGTQYNNGTYVAAGPAVDQVITCQNNFTTEPTSSDRLNFTTRHYDFEDYTHKTQVIDTTNNIMRFYNTICTYDGCTDYYSLPREDLGAVWLETQENTTLQYYENCSDCTGSMNQVLDGTTFTKTYYTNTVPPHSVVARPYSLKFDKYYGPYNLNTEHSGEIRSIEGIEVDISLPRGLYTADDAGNFMENTVEIEFIVTSEILKRGRLVSKAVDVSTHLVRGDSRDVIRQTIYPKYTKQTGAIYKIEFRRSPSTPVNPDIKTESTLLIDRIKYVEEAPNSLNFGDITVLTTRAKVSNNLSIDSTFKINCWVNGLSRTASIKDVITHLYSDKNLGAGLPESDLALIPTTEEFNGAFDTFITVKDAMDAVAKSGAYQLVLDGAKVQLIKDEPQPVRKALYNETNIIKDSLTISYRFGEDDDFDGVTTVYRSPIDFSQLSYTYPSTASRPDVIELLGCVDENVAEYIAEYTYKQGLSRRITAKFDTDEQGLSLKFLDRIGIAHETMYWGQSGQIKDAKLVSGYLYLTLDRSLDQTTMTSDIIECNDTIECDETMCTLATVDTIIFRQLNGGTTEPTNFTWVDDVTIKVPEVIPVGDFLSDKRDNIYFTMGTATTIVRDFLVTAVKPNDTSVTIEAINYDVTIYP